MTFPDDPLDITVSVAYEADPLAEPSSWTFTEITSADPVDNMVRPPVVITRGRAGEQGSVGPGSCDFDVINPDGIFSPRNVSGANYGRFGRNTPVRVSVDPGSGAVVRSTALVASWPPRWTGPDIDDHVPVRANGLLRRLGQGQSPLKSALRRSILGSSPLAYWPMEDGSDATLFASGLVGGQSLTPTDLAYVNPGAITGPAGSAPFAQFVASSDTTGGGVRPTALTGFSATRFSVTCVMTGVMPDPAITTCWDLFTVTTDRGHSCYATAYCGTTGGVVGTNYGIDVLFKNISLGFSARAFSFATINPFDGDPHVLVATWTQDGADVDVTMTLDGVAGTADTEAGQTLGTPAFLVGPTTRALTFGDVGNNTGGSVGLGHLAVWGNVTPPDPHEASTGYVGEEAAVRFARLCTEEGIPFDVQ